MPVTSADVLHVAALARLRLTAAEVERLTVQLNDILRHVAELAQADVSGIEPEPASGWPARLRAEDEPAAPLAIPPAQLSPEWRDGFITVPRLAAMDTPPGGEGGSTRARPAGEPPEASGGAPGGAGERSP
jgi:aspartyl-tRNA(Asn)/glutamyl-tRNA(Gln) amidotransferase subunit C